MKENKTKNKKSFLKLYSIIFLVICFVFGKAIIFQMSEKAKLNAKIEELEANKEQLNEEIENIKKDIQNKDTEEFVEKIARDRLNMVKKNEVIVKYK